ncbi:MAG TPA: LD-carboxypeptidase [Sediminibacterium sp.]|nr:LD-carboxypeptidase [Sediminibacterium sp.]
MKIVYPDSLQKNDLIGIVCPSGYLPAKEAISCVQTLESWGYRVRIGKTLGHQFHYFSGTDTERRDDLQQMLDDPEVKAVFCARGGYGMSRIIDGLDFRKFRKHPKWLIGYSDITVLHAHILKKYGIAALHAPMATAFQDGGARNEYVQSIRKVLQGKQIVYQCSSHPMNRKGEAAAILVGGNLTLLAHLTGTGSAPDYTDKLLFIEDVGEYLYNIDRMFLQLKRAGVLKKLAGLIIGGFTEMKDTKIPFGSDAYHILQSHISDTDYPVCFDFPVSHTERNYALVVGGMYRFGVGAKKVTLQRK